MADLKSEKLKKGGYAFHIYLQAGRGLLSISEKNNIDPIVCMKVFGKNKCTKALKQITSGTLVTWDDHFYFDKEITVPTELDRERLTIEVRDQRFLLRDSLIGVFEMDLTFIYYQENHAVLNKWVVLSNPQSEDFSTVRGYLKISASVLHETDKPVDLTVPAKLTEKEDLMIPPQIKLQTKQLIIQFLKAEGLPKMDDHGTIDAYCIVRFGGVEGKTSWITADEATMSVSWFEEVMLPVVVPSVSSKLMVTVFDYDRMSREDDMVGSFSFEWSKVLKNEYQDYFWVNIYGGPENVNNDEAKLMNSVTELASNWRGRALMRIFLKDDPRAMLKTQKIQDPKIIEKVKTEYEKGTRYEIRAKVLCGVAIPCDDRMSIIVKWGDLSMQTERQAGSNGCYDWYEALGRRMAEIPYGEKVLPDVFVYLVKGDKNVCFVRVPAEEFNRKNAEEKWLKLSPDKAIGEIKNDWEGGYIKVQIYIGLYEKEQEDYWTQRPVKSEGAKMKLICNIFQCRSLPPSDASGLADPYVVVYYQGRKISTDKEAKVQTLNPIWYEYHNMEIDFVGVEKSPPILVYVWDYDKLGGDDLMGICVIDVKDTSLVCIGDNNQAPRPRWLQLNMGKPGTEEGEILISFGLCSADFEPSYQISPATRDVTFEINILGLRDLKPSLGWMPVNKAFLKFDLKSLEMPGESQIIQELKTQPFEPGPNPNINTVLSFTSKIPVDHLFCPALTCNVHDYLLMGLSQPLLGTFYIKLGDIIQQSKGNFSRPQSMVFMEYSRMNPFEKSMSEDATSDNLMDLGIARKPSTENPTFYRKSMITPQIIPENPIAKKEAKKPVQLENIKKDPQFEDDDRQRRKIEVNRPDESIYYAIGYNREAEDGLKHYRYFINEEMENTEYIGESPFNIYEINRGQSRGLDGLMDSADKLDEKGQKTNSRVVGKFKGMIRIVENEEELEKKKKLNIIGYDGQEELDDETEEKKFFKTITKQLLVRTECVIRVYILNCIDLAQRDLDSPSDPYVRIKIGKNKIIDRENYKLDEPNPDFYKHYDLNTFLPGDSMLKIQLWDFDDILPDDKIGTTRIDLEDRYFSYKWNKLEHKPIETRPLYMKSSRQPQGYVRMWLEIHPSKDRPPPIDVTPKPPINFEARIIVWQSENVPTTAIEGASDLYMRAWINKEVPKETDTHYRCQNGNASWNWRMKFQIKLDGKSNFQLMLQLWDRDFFSSNAFIGDASMNFSDIAREAWESGSRVQKQGSLDIQERLTRREIPKFWVDFKNVDKNGKEAKAGRAQISFELVPDARAKACPVGEGRNEPNIDPPLPKPDGRMEWTFNPIKMMSQMCGPDLRSRFCLMISVALCVVLLLLMFPMIVSNAITNALF